MNFTLMLAVLTLYFSVIWAQDASSKDEKINYKVLEDLRATCSPLDTCALGKRNRSSTFLNCECDQLCGEFNDCCIDSEYNDWHRTDDKNIDNYAFCKALSAEIGIYVFNKCHPSWKGAEDIKMKCEQRHNVGTNIEEETIVTDGPTNVTFLNNYCASCNWATGPFQRWENKLVCESIERDKRLNLTQAFLKKFAVFSEDKSKIGVKLLNPGHKEVFHECILDYLLPDSLRSIIRPCRHNLVSKCDPKWENKSFLFLCGSYMAVIYIENKAYRNPHCALCNFKSLDHFKCEQSIGGIAPRNKPTKRMREPMSFSLLLDVNPSDGSVVGQTNKCAKNQIYDPYFKVCRRTGCAVPGYVIRDMKCVPK